MTNVDTIYGRNLVNQYTSSGADKRDAYMIFYGIRERYRPSDKKTPAERKKEGGIIERWRDGKWERHPNGNTDMTNPAAHRNGYFWFGNGLDSIPVLLTR